MALNGSASRRHISELTISIWCPSEVRCGIGGAAFAMPCAKAQRLPQSAAELKLRLAETFRLDREAYTEAKAPFLERVLSELNAHR